MLEMGLLQLKIHIYSTMNGDVEGDLNCKSVCRVGPEASCGISPCLVMGGGFPSLINKGRLCLETNVNNLLYTIRRHSGLTVRWEHPSLPYDYELRVGLLQNTWWA